MIYDPTAPSTATNFALSNKWGMWQDAPQGDGTIWLRDRFVTTPENPRAINWLQDGIVKARGSEGVQAE